MNKMPRRQETELEWILRLKAELHIYVHAIVLRSVAVAILIYGYM